MRHQRFISSPSQLPPDSFSAAFSAVAHDRGLLNSSRTAWFDACLCRPTPRGLPSSTSVAPKRRSLALRFTSHLLRTTGMIERVMSKDEVRLVWERPEPKQRPAPAPLNREIIVQTALAVADVEGLDAVTLRKVAGQLRTGPMRLYGYLSTKEELLDLMVDALYGEILAGGAVT